MIYCKIPLNSATNDNSVAEKVRFFLNVRYIESYRNYDNCEHKMVKKISLINEENNVLMLNLQILNLKLYIN